MIAALAFALLTGIGSPPPVGAANDVSWRLEGPIQQRVDALVDQWMVRAPRSNPGLLGLFARRDRSPRPEVVPWAGEFAGKYLIGAVQLLRMSDDPRLKAEADAVAEALLSMQAEDGYLGVFPADDRLIGHWDLWNHYHVLLGLLLWGEASVDLRPAEIVDRVIDKVWTLYGEGGKRPSEIGSPEVNFGFYHLLAMLHRRHPTSQIATLIQRFEEDMAGAGDWLRQGADGVPYYRLPRNGVRWESLHLVEGFYERYLDTGERRYRDAFVNLWTSIRDYDRHPSGAFSTNETASGSIYRAGSIETCCSIAWMALSVDMLRLTHDPTVADELELTFWNEILAAHHPSGGWCTYNTPLNGPRKPAFHDINFQWRPGYPELNCCSANSPRGFSMLPDWGVISRDQGVDINYYGPCEVRILLPDSTSVILGQSTLYPRDGAVAIRLGIPGSAREFPVRLRIPAWTAAATVSVNEGDTVNAVPGTYHVIDRAWADGDTIHLQFDLTQRHLTGIDAYAGRAVIWRGPILLAYDPRWNDFDAEVLAPIDVRAGVKLEREPDSAFPGDTSPIVLVTTRMENGEWVHLCDFGSAGASGTESVAWLPAAHADPPQNRLITPEDRASAAPGPVLFRWSVAASSERPATVLIARDGAFSDVIQTQHLESGRHWTLAGPLPSGEYYWRVDLGTAEDTHTSDVGRFTIDTAARDPFLTAGPGLELLAANLDGDLNPAHGRLVREQDVLPAPDKKGQPNGARTFNGSSSELVYQVAYIPEDSYSAAAWFRAEAQGREGLQEVLSCWHAGMDDPLRISFEGGAVSARIESGGFFATEAASVNRGEWYHVAAVKDGARLKLYLNGELKSSAAVPATIHTQSDEVGIGCNPYFPGEWFQGNIDEPAFWGRALSEDEIRQLALSKHPR